ncbi:hypothetical protein [Bradyrhizobium embrapense]|uniref:hypothetical protein n=1 Tax=Bradyrhizobium embrapense TaxID=630921 RepID=UPI00067ACE6E|nr:hypothetical protein [Bradyrhizobium embrapense]
MKGMREELEDLRTKIAECEEICDKAKDRDLSETLAKVVHHYAKLALHFRERADDLEKEIAKLSSEE